MRSFPIIVALVMTTGACTEGTRAPSEAPTPPEPLRQLDFVSGDHQEGTPGQPLADPLVVQVQDSAGRILAGVKVTWATVSGRSSLAEPATTVSGADGRAAMLLTPLTVRVDVRAVVQSRNGEDSVHFRTVPHPSATYDCLSPDRCQGQGLVFYPDSSFGIRWKNYEWPGSFARGGDWLTMWFKGTDWQASAFVSGDSLMVSFNFDAGMAGWEDGTFLLKSGSLPPP